MISGGKGGANTKTGLHFEGRVDFLEVLKKIPGYETRADGVILFNGKEVALNLRKNALYKFLKINGIDDKNILSKRLLPDDAILVHSTNTFYVIEIKFQNVAGSVDEKLQTCHFKKRQYEKLMKSLGVKVEYIYILSEWFKDSKYKDVLDYIKDVGCDYFFEEILLERIGLKN
ncbi:MAG: hypothetical protein RLY49_80 [Candidatus Parcubacteria bacterium]|jgi:hypothetical protein